MLCNRVNFIPVFRVPSFSFIYGLLIQQARDTMAFPQTRRIIKIFYSYASNEIKDKRTFDKLMEFLDLLRMNMSKESINLKIYDSDVSAGINRQKAIAAYVNNADIILLLVSASFLTSSYFHEVEVKRLLERCEAGTVRVLAILYSLPVDLIMGIPLLEKSDVLPANRKPISDWTNKNSAFSAVVRGIRKVVDELLISPLTNAYPPSGSPEFPLWIFPYKQNPFFTGREEILSALHTYFTAHQSAQTHIQVIQGIDGIGKSQIAIEYIFQHKEEYQAIFWIRADTRRRFRADITSLAGRLFLSGSERRNEQMLYAAVQHWLQNNHAWLLILDDIEDFTLVHRIVPSESSGHVLLTTHAHATGSFTHTIKVDLLTPDEGALFLLRRAKYITSDKPEEKIAAADYAQASAIVRELDGFTLALEQAGAYIEETESDLTTYLELYHQYRAELLQHRSPVFDSQERSVTATLSLAFSKVTSAYTPAMELLRLLSFLYADAIPDDMIEYGTFEQNPVLQKLATNPLDLRRAIATLFSYSLISRHADRNTLSIHCIVQAVAKDKLTPEQQRQWAIWVVQLVNAAFPSSDFSNWPICEIYLPHAQLCAEYVTRWHLVSDDAAELLYDLGSYCCERALYSDAETYLTQALSIREQEAGLEHLETAQCMGALALLYQEQGSYERAETFYQRSLAIYEQLLGSDHPETAIALNNLALLYQDQGKLALIEPLYHRVLAIYERSYGPDHPEIATTLNNLALLYQKQSRYTQAEPLYQRALAIRETALKPGHPDIAQALNNLAMLYQYQRRYEQVEPLLLRALEMNEQTLGANHPTTAISLNNLALLYRVQEKYQQAEKFYRRAITIYERVLGAEHPKLAPILKNLAILYKLQEDYEQAEPLYLRALIIYEHTFGLNYSGIAPILNSLADVYIHHKKYEQAESLYQRAIAIDEEAPSSEQADRSLVMKKYVALLELMQRVEEARALRQVIESINDKSTHKPPDTHI
jgi:tetratricopeptide (TPR) repeat protein